jgi:hypothetical protein
MPIPTPTTDPHLTSIVRAVDSHGTSGPRTAFRWLGTLALAVLTFGIPDPTAGSRDRPQMPHPHFAIPISLLEEHAELHTAFEAASRLSGETGVAARRVVALRAPHVAKEQRVAYPLLRLLPLLTEGKAEQWMAELLPLADQLRTELPTLKAEHVIIGEALDVLKAEAWAEEHPEHAFLAERLKHHMRIEEELLFPAARVTAEYVRGLLKH